MNSNVNILNVTAQTVHERRVTAILCMPCYFTTIKEIIKRIVIIINQIGFQ